MKKAFRIILFPVLFFSLFYSLTNIDWITLLQINEYSAKTEEKLGDLLWKMHNQKHPDLNDDYIYNCTDSILTKLCRGTGIERKKIKLHISQSEEINAFALPGNHLVVNQGIIKKCKNPEELSGIIGHELAHIEKRHITKKIKTQIGLSVAVGLVVGNEGAEKIAEVLMKFTSLGFDRQLEKEADIYAIELLNNAKVNTIPFAEFMEKMADGENSDFQTDWFSTHPLSKDRAQYIIENSNSNVVFEPIIHQNSWQTLKSKLSLFETEN